MTHCIILSEEFFGEFYADAFSDYPSDIYTGASEYGSSSEYSSDSDDVIIRPTKKTKNLSNSDKESENETHRAGKDFTGVSGVTFECNNLQSVSEMTELSFDWSKEK